MFVVVTAAFRLLYVSVILGHARRKILHLDVTQHPTAGWLSRQLTEAFPWDTAPRYLLRDRDSSYGGTLSKRARAMGITEVVTASRSPWQNACVERVIGSIRRECLDHVLVTNERHLRRVLISCLDYYHRSRTHLSLAKDCPDARPIQPPNCGKVIAIPQVGGLHQRYQRLAACSASRAAQSPTIACMWRAMPSRAESPSRIPIAWTDQRDRGWLASGSAPAFRHAVLTAARISLQMEFRAGTGTR